MVKFAKYLELQLVPEWREAYVNYKKLKKDIKCIPNVRVRTPRSSSAGGTLHGEGGLDGDSTPTPRGRQRRRSSLVYHRSQSRSRIPLNANCIHVCVVRGDASDSSGDTYYTDVLPPVNECAEEVAFFARMDAQLNKVNSFYAKKEKEYTSRFAHLQRQIAALNEMKSALAKKQEQLTSAAPEGKPGSLPPPEPDPLRHASRSLNWDGPPASVQLQEMVVGERRAREQEGATPAGRGAGEGTRTHGGAQQATDNGSHRRALSDGGGGGVDIAGLRLVIPAATPVLALNKMSKVLWEDIAKKGPRPDRFVRQTSEDVPEILKQSHRNVRNAEKLLYSALVEFYRGLGLLKSFGSLNVQAFGKIMKKHDKVLGWNATRVYLAAVEGAYFQTSQAVPHMMVSTEALFAKQFAGDSHKQAMAVLRPLHRSASHRVTYALGFLSGCILSLLITFIVLISRAGSYDKRAGGGYLNSVFPVFNAMILLLLHMYMYGLDVYTWRLKQINYSFIFEFRPGTELRFREVLLAATFLTTLTLGGMVLHLVVHTADPTKDGGAGEYIPLAVLLVWVLLFICPFDVFWRDSRVFLLRILRHLVLAPLYRIMLADFFVGDQLTSQVTFLQEVQYCCCYYFGGHFKTRNGLACTTNGTYRSMLYVVAILPYWFRFAQCWRRFFEEGRDHMHLWNAGKYLSAMLAVTFRLWYLNSPSTAGLVLGVMAAVVATAYQAYWDVAVDWGLLRRAARHPWLRDQLLLKHHALYFLSMGVNVALRLAWIQSIARFRFGGHVPAPIMTLLAAALEVVRRGLWNFYRLENEHLNNVGKFRAVRSIPLPFKDLEGAEV